MNLKNLWDTWKSKIPETGAAKSFLSKIKIHTLFDGIKHFDIEGTLHRFYSPVNRPLIQKSFALVLVGSLSYGGGKMIGEVTSLVLKPDLKKSSPKPLSPFIAENFKDETRMIEEVNLFNTGSEGAKKKKSNSNEICKESKIASALPIKLMNTIVLQDAVKSIAAVQLRGSNAVEDFREKETISTLAILGKIETQKIIFRNKESGECEYISSGETSFGKRGGITVHSEEEGAKLFNAQAAKEGIKTDGSRFTIKNKLRDEVLGDLGNILTQAKAIPITNPDGSMAFKIVNVVPGSIYSYLNIQDEDIIEGINGKKIQNLNEVMTMFKDIKTVSNLSLTIKRDGVEQNFDYGFEQ